LDRLEPIAAANQFVKKHFPDCDGALLSGSVVRGEETSTSDLDLVIFDQNVKSSYRESLHEFGWPIEIFVHNLHSYKYFFEDDCKQAKPSLPRMVSEGIIIKDNGIIHEIKNEAKIILENGPEKWTEETIQLKRYFITDALMDFKGCDNRAEALFIANTLADLISEFVLRTNRKWIGTSKWVVRSLKQYDEDFANEFVEAFDHFYITNDKSKIIRLGDIVLQSYGGPLFEGFSLGKN